MRKDQFSKHEESSSDRSPVMSTLIGSILEHVEFGMSLLGQFWFSDWLGLGTVIGARKVNLRTEVPFKIKTYWDKKLWRKNP